MEHRLVVATVELFTTHRVESSEGQVYVDGTMLERPLRLQADGRLDV